MKEINKQKYFDRELSWLSFNNRVLQEAKDENVPLLERLKFLAIYSSNLDEFFRVRVASLRSLLSLKEKAQKKLKFNPNELLEQIKQTVNKQQEELGKIFYDELIPGLIKENIFIVDDTKVLKQHTEFLSNYFNTQLVPYLQPTLLDKNNIATFLKNKAIYLAVRLKRKTTKQLKSIRYKYAIVEIPSDKAGRFVSLPKVVSKNYVILVDDIIRMFLPNLLPGYVIDCSYSVKLTRDAELYIDDEFTGNLLSKIKKGLSKRKTGMPSRFLYDGKMPKTFLKFLTACLQLKKEDLIAGGRYHNFNDFFGFRDFNKQHLKYKPMPPLACNELENKTSIFDTLSIKDILLSFPYQSFNYVIKLLEEAASDADVKSIKITLYRVADDSKIVKALCKAAENGKDVTAFVEVKARFDEESNFESAEQLEKSGVKVFFSFPGLKVHSKLCLIERIENGKQNFYTYLATGNFNEKTARIYCDYALLTSYQTFAKDALKVFKILERNSEEETFDELLVAPFNMRSEFYKMIDNEIKNADNGKEAEIVVKLNSLEDRKMIKKLYLASAAGVKVKIIVRGICCLIPGIKNLSENIEVRSIVDRFLEHARVYIFKNSGDTKYYLASADWMRRNLSRRIEVAFPVYDKNIHTQIKRMIELQWKDTVKARIIDENQSNKYVDDKKEKKIRSQYEIYEYLKSLN